jgi:hypothetical protein
VTSNLASSHKLVFLSSPGFSLLGTPSTRVG